MNSYTDLISVSSKSPGLCISPLLHCSLGKPSNVSKPRMKALGKLIDKVFKDPPLYTPTSAISLAPVFLHRVTSASKRSAVINVFSIFYYFS